VENKNIGIITLKYNYYNELQITNYKPTNNLTEYEATQGKLITAKIHLFTNKDNLQNTLQYITQNTYQNEGTHIKLVVV